MAPAKCSTCKTNVTRVNSGVTCTSCNNTFHWNCGNVNDKVIREISSGIVKQWKCSLCDKRKSQPIVASTKLTILPSNEATSTPRVNNEATENSLTIQNINTVVNDMRSFFNEKFLELEQITRVLNDYGHRINDMEDNCKTLTFNTQNLDVRVDNLEQATLSNNLEISGVPLNHPEDLAGIVQKISIGISHPIEKTDWSNVYRQHRQTNQDKPPSIILVFNDRSKRNSFLSSAKKVRGLTTTKIGVAGDESFIFVNEHLTKARKKLFYTAKAFRAANNYKYLWTNKGKIYLRKNDGCQAINVNFYTNFDKIDGSK